MINKNENHVEKNYSNCTVANTDISSPYTTKLKKHL